MIYLIFKYVKRAPPRNAPISMKSHKNENMLMMINIFIGSLGSDSERGRWCTLIYIYIYIYIYTGVDPAAYFWGGARRNLTEFSTRRVAFWSVASRFDMSWTIEGNLWNALFTKNRQLMSYYVVYCAITDKFGLK